MPNLKISNQHSLATTSQKVEYLCQPLSQKYGIKFFSYGRFFDDGTCYLLSNNWKLYQHFFEKQYKLVAPIPSNILSQSFSYLIPNHGDYQQASHDCRQFFNLEHALDLIERNDGYFDFFCFASEANNNNIINIYLNNLEFFKKFTLYFKEKACDMIDDAKNNKFVLPEIMRPNFTGINKIDKNRKNTFSINSKSNNHEASVDGITLSSRQTQCMHYLIRGKTAKQIGKILNLSPRTIECYLENLKNKLRCATSAELIEKAIDSGFICHS